VIQSLHRDKTAHQPVVVDAQHPITMAEQPSQVDTLFEKLDKAIASGSHEKAVKVADNSK
jgi:hypothetical protein